jgi:hypothetical protein
MSWHEFNDGTYRILLDLRPAPTGRVDVLAATVGRLDGASLSTRDVRAAELGQVFRKAQRLYTELAPPCVPVPSEPIPKPGRRGYSAEHWRVVAEMWEQAQQVAPQRPVAWLRERMSERMGRNIPYQTISRWRQIVSQEST